MCGIGFVADARGRSSRALIDAGLEALVNLQHRGASGSDGVTGDGAGMMLPVPYGLLAGSGSEPARTGVAMIFGDPTHSCRALVTGACGAEGIAIREWRQVPIDRSALGAAARATMPLIEQAVLEPPAGVDEAEAERRAYAARLRVQVAGRAARIRVYVASMSFSTVTYKALCRADRLAAFYPDLNDDRTTGWFALFHQRYATNTTPAWERAQPFRLAGHNGEINTIRANFAGMRARGGMLGAGTPEAEELLRGGVDPTGSDSAMLDETLELLVRGGRDLAHALTMLVPPAWEGRDDLDPRLRDFLRYHSCVMEPWDGPAGLVFSDGAVVGAALDRNGLRPLRVVECEDGLVGCASEAGAIPVAGRGRIRRLRLGPGELLIVDPGSGGVITGEAARTTLAGEWPYGEWLANLVVCDRGRPAEAPGEVTARQVAAGWTKEEVTVALRPAAVHGHEPTSSMGDDTAQPPLSAFPRMVFAFLKQRFAQVTNPPIDHLRERQVMSLTTRLGARGPVLEPSPAAAALREYPEPVLFPSAVAELERVGARVIDATFDAGAGPDGLGPALVSVAAAGERAVRAGDSILVVTDRFAGPDRVALPSALAAGAVHHRLIAAGLRPRASIVVDCDDARESHHIACLVTNGVDAVCPRLALETVARLAASNRLGGDVPAPDAQDRFVAALEDGLLKIMSKMGISVLDSYRSAQVVEAIGLAPEVVDLCFAGMSSPLGGLTFVELGADVVNRHFAAYGPKPALVNTGFVKHRTGGEYHATNPEVVGALQDSVGLNPEVEAAHELRRAVRGNHDSYRRFAALSNNRPSAEPRDLLEFTATDAPLSMEEVEDARAIARRFSTGAMSHGALSSEAHETLALALNMLGGAANSGEGGEDPLRFNNARNCSIKQVASARFGVTPAYLAAADELQIKIAQGSKPGEGGQLPGTKVSVEIARLRHTVPGVALISPPPHHDIYSIEDLAQLIFDLKQANPRALVSVKLVSSEGVGTIATGVVKGFADIVHISGGDGGTGASPLSSIKNAGLPWEVGLAETHAQLQAAGLRERVRLRIDGGMKTGRDVVGAALLGADEYSFGTAALIAEGCILVRTCHRNTCPVGIATQDPMLRARFAGTPEMVVSYLLMVAEETRTILASLGLRSLGDAIGRTDLLRKRVTGNVRADSLAVDRLIARGGPVTTSVATLRPRSELGDRLHADALRALGATGEADLAYAIRSTDRAVGTRLGCAGVSGRVRAKFEGPAGQSFGAWLSNGIELTLVGEANDYVGKGMSGGRIVITPPPDDAGDPVLAGNTGLYGATGGQLFVAGRAGERFAVRNSGAVAVVEGTGDHACEYMTAGAVVVLGETGINLGAGMSGGEAYVYDSGDSVSTRLNSQLVAAYEPTTAQLESLRRVIVRHCALTGSVRAGEILADWKNRGALFKRVVPVAQVARLEALFEGAEAGAA